ncbi:MAG: ribonuclease E/G [Rhodospirillales bacterium]|nr:ribonuclease E/G [Rhodospirillales bacterium]
MVPQAPRATARRILVAAAPGEVRVAVLRGESLDAYAVWRPGAPDGVGDVHRGRVSARVPAMAGTFVALPGERAEAIGFLPDTSGGAGLGVGEAVLVRVVRAAQGGKGPRLAALPPDDAAGLPGAGAPALLRRGPGAVERLAARYPDAPILIDDPALAASLRPALGPRAAHEPGGFDDALEAEIDALAATSVALPGGGAMHIHPTPALTAIDLDAGAAISVRGGKTAAHLAMNRAAVPELARQIRLRNLAGAILVDLAGLPVRQRSAVGPALAAALAEDDLRPRLLGFTALGLAEILRPRIHPPLHEVLAGPHAAGLAALRRIAAEAAAAPAAIPGLRAAPGIVAALQADPVALAELSRRTGRPLRLEADPQLTGWVLI